MTALKVVEPPPNGVSWYWAEPGYMWPCDWPKHVVEYRSPCWVVRLPGGAFVWHTNEKATESGEFWTVTGEPPNITVEPSINVGPEIWHGHITDGVLSPDTDSSGE